MLQTELLRNDLPTFVAIRQDLHRHPELGLAEHRTSDLVAHELASYGYAVHRGLAGTGLVATLTNGSGRRSVGIRADMDALPILEETGVPYASATPGVMHACGHDGHTAMLLAAAKGLADRRNFDGTVHLIFQPAEETVGGARIMVEEGLFERFPCDAVYALHNDPTRPLGQFAFRAGPIMAAVDEALITVQGRGGHGAEPEHTRDPIVAGAAIVGALQTIVARNVAATDLAVVTVGAFHAGSVSNVIPDRATLLVGVRTFEPTIRDTIEQRIGEIARGQAASFGLEARVDYERSYDATINDSGETARIRDLAVRHAGAAAVVDIPKPMMGSEDFCYMLQARPGTYFFLGTGRPDRPSAGLHHPGFDFNDDALPIGASFWVTLVEDVLRP